MRSLGCESWPPPHRRAYPGRSHAPHRTAQSPGGHHPAPREHLHQLGEILLRVMHREEGQTTGIGNGVAIPHGKARAVNRMVAACGVSPTGVDFESVDGEPVTLFVLLAAPESVGSLQVKVLANISRVLKEESVRRSLREAGSPDEFIDALKAAEAVHIP